MRLEVHAASFDCDILTPHHKYIVRISIANIRIYKYFTFAIFHGHLYTPMCSSNHNRNSNMNFLDERDENHSPSQLKLGNQGFHSCPPLNHCRKPKEDVKKSFLTENSDSAGSCHLNDNLFSDFNDDFSDPEYFPSTTSSRCVINDELIWNEFLNDIKSTQPNRELDSDRYSSFEPDPEYRPSKMSSNSVLDDDLIWEEFLNGIRADGPKTLTRKSGCEDLFDAEEPLEDATDPDFIPGASREMNDRQMDALYNKFISHLNPLQQPKKSGESSIEVFNKKLHDSAFGDAALSKQTSPSKSSIMVKCIARTLKDYFEDPDCTASQILKSAKKNQLSADHAALLAHSRKHTKMTIFQSCLLSIQTTMACQLLTQAFLLVSYNPALKKFRTVLHDLLRTLPKRESIIRRSLHLIKNFKPSNINAASISGLFPELTSLLNSNSIFTYKELHPLKLFDHSLRNNDYEFSYAEDCLLTLGTDRFSHITPTIDKVYLIQRYIMPARSLTAIDFRLRKLKKNKVYSKNAKIKNPLIHLQQHGSLPMYFFHKEVDKQFLADMLH